MLINDDEYGDEDDDAQTDNGDAAAPGAGEDSGINTANELEMLLKEHTREDNN